MPGATSEVAIKKDLGVHSKDKKEGGLGVVRKGNGVMAHTLGRRNGGSQRL